MNNSNELNIYLIDDDVNIRFIIHRIFKRETDGDIKTFEYIEDTINLLKEGDNPDLIVSDLMMPNVNGKDLYEWIKENREDILSRVFIMSGMILSRNEEINNFINYMKTEKRFIKKPFDISKIKLLVKDILDRKEIVSYDLAS